MNRISRYMLKNYLVSFFLAIVVLLGINLLLIFLSELKNIGNHEYSYPILFNYIVFLIPQNFLDIFPYALLIGSMTAFGSMAYHSELTAINSYGIGIKRVFKIILLQTFVISTFFTIASNSIAPKYANDAQTLKNVSLNKSVSDKSVWFRTSNQVTNIGEVISDKQLSNIKIYFIRDGDISSILSAKSANYSDKWILKGVEILDIANSNSEKMSTHFLSSKEFVPFEILSSQFTKRRYISIENLYENIVFHDNLGLPYENHKVIFWKKILLPFSCCVIVFVGLPFLFTKTRSTNQSQKLLFGILFGITYFVITSLITNIALIIGVPAFLSVVLSIAVFVGAGIILFNNLIKKNIPI